MVYLLCLFIIFLHMRALSFSDDVFAKAGLYPRFVGGPAYRHEEMFDLRCVIGKLES